MNRRNRNAPRGARRGGVRIEGLGCQVSVADVMQFMKSQSGKLLKARFPFLEDVMWGRSGIWSRGYCVSTVGLNEKEILAYVAHQDKEDRGQQKLNL